MHGSPFKQALLHVNRMLHPEKDRVNVDISSSTYIIPEGLSGLINRKHSGQTSDKRWNFATPGKLEWQATVDRHADDLLEDEERRYSGLESTTLNPEYYSDEARRFNNPVYDLFGDPREWFGNKEKTRQQHYQQLKDVLGYVPEESERQWNLAGQGFKREQDSQGRRFHTLDGAAIDTFPELTRTNNDDPVRSPPPQRDDLMESVTTEYGDMYAGLKEGGGVSSLNDSININGQPHRLVWANPKEERVLKDMGGSGKEVLGKPAYFDESIYDVPNEDPTFGGGWSEKDDFSDYLESGGFEGNPADILTGTEKVGERVGVYRDPELQSDLSRYRGTFTPVTGGFGERDDPGDVTGTGLQTMYGPHSYTSKVIEGFGENENAEADAGARRRYINQHLANFPGGRRDPVTQELFRADEDWERGIGIAGMAEALRTEYGGQQDVFGAMHKQAASLVQARLNKAYNEEIELTPMMEQGTSKEYKEGIVDAVLSNPATALKEFGLTNVSKSTGLLPEAKVEERGWRDVLGDLATPMAVKVVDALSKGIPALMDIWGTGEVNGRGVYIKKDGTIIPFTSDTERGNIESGSLRGENVVPKKLKPRPVQVASAEEVVKKPSALETLLDARSEGSSLEKELAKMEDRVNRYYRTPEDPTRNIFSELA